MESYPRISVASPLSSRFPQFTLAPCRVLVSRGPGLASVALACRPVSPRTYHLLNYWHRSLGSRRCPSLGASTQTCHQVAPCHRSNGYLRCPTLRSSRALLSPGTALRWCHLLSDPPPLRWTACTRPSPAIPPPRGNNQSLGILWGTTLSLQRPSELSMGPPCHLRCRNRRCHPIQAFRARLRRFTSRCPSSLSTRTTTWLNRVRLTSTRCQPPCHSRSTPRSHLFLPSCLITRCHHKCPRLLNQCPRCFRFPCQSCQTYNPKCPPVPSPTCLLPASRHATFHPHNRSKGRLTANPCPLTPTHKSQPPLISLTHPCLAFPNRIHTHPCQWFPSTPLTHPCPSFPNTSRTHLACQCHQCTSRHFPPSTRSQYTPVQFCQGVTLLRLCPHRCPSTPFAYLNRLRPLTLRLWPLQVAFLYFLSSHQGRQPPMLDHTRAPLCQPGTLRI